jgi:hypothetical protein
VPLSTSGFIRTDGVYGLSILEYLGGLKVWVDREENSTLALQYPEGKYVNEWRYTIKPQFLWLLLSIIRHLIEAHVDFKEANPRNRQ